MLCDRYDRETGYERQICPGTKTTEQINLSGHGENIGTL